MEFGSDARSKDFVSINKVGDDFAKPQESELRNWYGATSHADEKKLGEVEGDDTRQERFHDELKLLRDVPIPNVKYGGVSIVKDNDKDTRLVARFHLEKHGLKLRVIMSSKWPNEEPVLEFVGKIPKHPEIDSLDGRVKRFWPEDGRWTPAMRVREMITTVLETLQDAGIPDGRRRADSRGFRFDLSINEFHFFLNDKSDGGALFVRDIKQRFNCQVKYCGMGKKWKGAQMPHFLIFGSEFNQMEVAAAIDQYLVTVGRRRTVTFRRPKPPSPVSQKCETVVFAETAPSRLIKSQGNQHATVDDAAFASTQVLEMNPNDPKVPKDLAKFELDDDIPVAILVQVESETGLNSHSSTTPTMLSNDREPGNEETIDDLVACFKILPEPLVAVSGTNATFDLMAFGSSDSETDVIGSVNPGNHNGEEQYALDETGANGQPTAAVNYSAPDETLVVETSINEQESQTDAPDLIQCVVPDHLRDIQLQEFSSMEVATLRNGVKATMQDFQYLGPDRLWSAMIRRIEYADMRLRNLEGLLMDFPALIIRAKRCVGQRRLNLVSARNDIQRFSCQLCMMRVKDTVLPCGDVFCEQCANVVTLIRRRCPICRQGATAFRALK